MTKATAAMENFMRKLAHNEYRKENQPDDGLVITEEFIQRQIQSYSQFLIHSLLWER